MPGAGITARNIAALAAATGAHEFHASAKHQLPSGMHHRRPLLSDMEGGELCSDVEQVRALVTALATTAQNPAGA
jgi:copper homeostasis protein